MAEKEAFVKNANDPEQVKEAKRKERDQQLRDEEDTAFVLSTPEGLRFVKRYLKRCGVFHQNPAIGEPERTAYVEGERSVGLMILRDIIDTDPSLLSQVADDE